MSCKDDCGMCGRCAEDLKWETENDELSKRLGHDQDTIPIYSDTEEV